MQVQQVANEAVVVDDGDFRLARPPGRGSIRSWETPSYTTALRRRSPRAAVLTEVELQRVEKSTLPVALAGQDAENAEGFQPGVGVPVLPRGGDRVARHAAPRGPRYAIRTPPTGKLWGRERRFFAMGIGIWSMHFVATLALKLPIPVLYDLSLTALSWVVRDPRLRRGVHRAAQAHRQSTASSSCRAR